MTGLIWTLDHIREELDWVMQYGKAQILSLPKQVCPNYIDLFSPEECYNDECDHFDGWEYGWYCWCGDGYREETWEKCVKELEAHMWMGLHK